MPSSFSLPAALRPRLPAMPLAALLLLAPLTQALFDFRLQAVFQAGLLAACLFPLLSRWPGRLSRQESALCAAAGLSLLSLLASPVRTLVWFEWANPALGLLIFFYSGRMLPGERENVLDAVLLAGWISSALAAAQFLAWGGAQPDGALGNPNALALFSVMLFPAALGRGRHWLAAALLATLALTRSAGAALALAATVPLFLGGRRPGWKKAVLAALLLLAAVLILWQVPERSVAERLSWWRSAFSMFIERPLAGFGHAAFTYVYPAFAPAGGAAEGSIYAHSYYLEFLAENGAFCGALWFGLLAWAVTALEGWRRWAAAAALVHSVFDFGLSVPANFWIFCFLAAPSAAGGEEPRRAPGAVIAAAALAAAAWLWALYGHDRALLFLERGHAAARGGEYAAAGEEYRRSLAIEPGPAALAGLGAAELRLSGGGKDRARLFSSAVFFERAVAAYPYSPGLHSSLAGIYRLAGEKAMAERAERRRASFFSGGGCPR